MVRTISGSTWGHSARLVEELRIGEPAGDDDYALGRTGAMDVGQDGTTYVHDAAMKALRAYDSTGTARDTLRMPTWPEMPPPTMRFSPRGLFALRPDGTFATARSDRYAVDLPTLDGRVLRVERPSLAAIALAPGERAEQQEFFDALARRNPSGERVAVPVTKPLIRALRVAPDGRLWVQLHTAAVESDEPPVSAPSELRTPDRWTEPEAWDVFEPDGSFLGHLELPPRASLLAMRGNRAWGVILGDDDVPYVVRWRVDGAAISAAP